MRSLIGLFVWLSISAAHSALAQGGTAGTGSLIGTVMSETTQSPLDGAIVRVVDLNRSSTSLSTGAFRLDSLTPGDYRLEVRKLGFRVLTTNIRIEAGQRFDVDLLLEPVAPQQLETVEVKADMDHLTKEILSRKASTGGTFFLQEMLDSSRGVSLGELLQRHAKGARMQRYNRTGASLLSTSRGMTSITNLPAADPTDRKSPRACYAKVVVDNVTIYAPDGLNGHNPPNLDVYDAATLAAVEFYPGPATTPAQFSSAGTQCGTLVIWTKSHH